MKRPVEVGQKESGITEGKREDVCTEGISTSWNAARGRGEEDHIVEWSGPMYPKWSKVSTW